MKKNFWKSLKKPIIALAPMAAVTNAPFRFLCEEQGAAVIYNEMVNVDAITFKNKRTLDMLKRDKRSKNPFVVQLFGNNPENFAKATKIIDEVANPDGFDINFGCPAPKVLKNKCGAGLFQDVERAHAVIEAVISATDKPVSVKTRASAGKMDILKFVDYMKDLDIKALMLHSRHLSQGLSGEVDWKIIGEVKKKFKGIVLGNGGITSRKDALAMIKETGIDGVAIAQGALGNPWIFKNMKSKKEFNPGKKEIFEMILKHTSLHTKLRGENLVELRRHLCHYIKNLPDSKKIRSELVQVENLKDVKAIIKKYS